MSSRVNEVNGENLQDPPIKNPGYANALRQIQLKVVTSQVCKLAHGATTSLVRRASFTHQLQDVWLARALRHLN